MGTFVCMDVLNSHHEHHVHDGTTPEGIPLAATDHSAGEQFRFPYDHNLPASMNSVEQRRDNCCAVVPYASPVTSSQMRAQWLQRQAQLQVFPFKKNETT
jgi:hypothetical protein